MASYVLVAGLCFCFYFFSFDCSAMAGWIFTRSSPKDVFAVREFPTPATFAQHPPASGRKEGERGREGGGKGRGKEKGRDPHGLVDTPHVPNCDLMSATCEKVLYPFQQRPRVPLCMQVSKKFQYFSNSSWRINSWHSILFYSLRNLTIDIIFLDFMWETILQCTHFSFTIIFI